MKKIFVSLVLLVFNCLVYSQDIKVQEPDFVGQTYLLKEDGSIEVLEKSLVTSATKAKFSLINSGYSQTLSMDGCCSSVKAEVVNGLVKFIIRVADNSLDPNDVVQLVQFEKSKRERKTEVLTVRALSGVNQGGKVKRASFYGKKYGASSYLLNVSIPGPGEYGIFLPETNGQPVKFASTFNIQ